MVRPIKPFPSLEESLESALSALKDTNFSSYLKYSSADTKYAAKSRKTLHSDLHTPKAKNKPVIPEIEIIDNLEDENDGARNRNLTEGSFRGKVESFVKNCNENAEEDSA